MVVSFLKIIESIEYYGKFTLDILATEDYKAEKFRDKDYESSRISVKPLPKEGTKWISQELKARFYTWKYLYSGRMD